MNSNRVFCEWCHGNTFDDMRGNCICCGGNRNVVKNKPNTLGMFIKEIEEYNSEYFGTLIDEYTITDIHGKIHLQYKPFNENRIVVIFEKLHKNKDEKKYIFNFEGKTIQTPYRNEKVRVKYLSHIF